MERHWVSLSLEEASALAKWKAYQLNAGSQVQPTARIYNLQGLENSCLKFRIAAASQGNIMSWMDQWLIWNKTTVVLQQNTKERQLVPLSAMILSYDIFHILLLFALGNCLCNNSDSHLFHFSSLPPSLELCFKRTKYTSTYCCVYPVISLHFSPPLSPSFPFLFLYFRKRIWQQKSGLDFLTGASCYANIKLHFIFHRQYFAGWSLSFILASECLKRKIRNNHIEIKGFKFQIHPDCKSW